MDTSLPVFLDAAEKHKKKKKLIHQQTLSIGYGCDDVGPSQLKIVRYKPRRQTSQPWQSMVVHAVNTIELPHFSRVTACG